MPYYVASETQAITAIIVMKVSKLIYCTLPLKQDVFGTFLFHKLLPLPKRSYGIRPDYNKVLNMLPQKKNSLAPSVERFYLDCCI